MTAPQLRLLSGGAAHGVVQAVAPRFRTETGAEIVGTFGPVGAMKDRLLAGEPADLVILTKALVAELAAAGRILADTCADLGRVGTGVAVKQGDKVPDISSGPALRAALLAAPEIYFPDPQRATAGIHFAGVLERLGLRAALAPRLRPHASGAAAMRAMSSAAGSGALACTQITEIMITPGVTLVGPLPGEFELATVYSAAVCATAASTELARRLAAQLTGELTQTLRTQCGFEPCSS
ncbi:MAG TPA: substrate-binding domain-containing protein [Burkholderiales bacterium]|nr:substrate-binding domain-containing protein [Burkholderiales bacterium]